MRSRILAVLALSIAVIAPAAFAQQNGTQSEAASGAMAPAQSGGIEVTGTIVSIDSSSVKVKLDSVTAAEGAPVSADIAVGKTAEFKLDATTQMPRTLSAGDPVDLWFKSDNGSMVATRLALAVSADQPATTSSNASATTNSDNSAMTSKDTSAPASQGENASTSSQPSSTAAYGSSGDQQAPTAGAAASTAAPQPAHEQHLPKTGSPLPLIGLLGVAALIAAFALRFVVKA